MMRRLIVTADDFGLATEVNEAIERGHTEGVLSTASLMVRAPASGDAIRRARSLPSLKVGLHLVLVNGEPVSNRREVPALVDRDGRFSSNLFGAGVRYFFLPAVRKQLEIEIRAQFQAFAQTGLQLDHVNAQNHMHVHPTILSMLLRIGREFGLRAVRLPYEPFLPSLKAMHTKAAARFGNGVLLWPWLAAMKFRIRNAGLFCNDYIFGMSDTGCVDSACVRSLLEYLPDGVSELYFHPAASHWPLAQPAHYNFTAEFAALIDPAVRNTIASRNITPVTFSGMASHAA